MRHSLINAITFPYKQSTMYDIDITIFLWIIASKTVMHLHFLDEDCSSPRSVHFYYNFITL